jgi:hypothetical protein
MKFDLQEIPPRLRYTGPQVGDVFRMKGGRRGGGYWVIVGQTGTGSVCLGIDEEGAIVSSTTYSTSVFEQRDRVGFVSNMSDLILSIQWEAA